MSISHLLFNGRRMSFTRAHKDPTFFAIIFAALIGPLATDTYLPSFQSISTALLVPIADVQATLAIFLLSYTLFNALHGAISDSVGRRLPLLVSGLVFSMSSVACGLSDSIEALTLYRLLQGVSAGSAIVIGRSAIPEIFPTELVQKKLSELNLVFVVGPLVGPLLGAWITENLGWRYIFFMLAATSAASTLALYIFLEETLAIEKRMPFDFSAIATRYLTILSSRRFLPTAGLICLSQAGLLAIVTASPQFISLTFELPPSAFAWQVVPMVGGIFIGSRLAARAPASLSIRRQTALGISFITGAVIIGHILLMLDIDARYFISIPTFLYGIGVMTMIPPLVASVLLEFSKMRGTASSALSLFQGASFLAISVVITPLVDGRPFALLAFQATSIVLASCLAMRYLQE